MRLILSAYEILLGEVMKNLIGLVNCYLEHGYWILNLPRLNLL
jgi:hypothetical protein